MSVLSWLATSLMKRTKVAGRQSESRVGSTRRVRKSKPASPAAALVQRLEERALLAATSNPIAQSLLEYAQSASDPNWPTTPPSNSNASMFLFAANGDVSVRITANDVNALLPLLAQRGFHTIAALPDHHVIDGTISAANLNNLADLTSNGLRGVLPIYRPITSVGNFTSEAAFVQETERVRNALPQGYDGSGITIGVLSDSFNNRNEYTADINSGDLPSNVNVIQDLSSGGSDEGRAMLQLIYDLAPNATLAFATAFVGGEAGFANNILALANTANADIIVDDVIYFAEPMFQDGIVAQAVDQVKAAGVAYFSSAGNQADQSWEGINLDVVDSGSTTFGNVLDFDTSDEVEDFRQQVTIPQGRRIRLALQWDDPFYTANGVDTDVDIRLVIAGTNTVVASSLLDSIDNQTPFEFLDFSNSTTTTQYEIIISVFAGPDPGRVKYVNFGNDIGQGVIFEYDTQSSTVYGHAAADGAQAIAAVPYFNQTTPEGFTSIGSTTILYTPNGTRLSSPVVRQTPDLAGIDGTNTTFFGQSLPDGDGLNNNFFGTSAAAPHVAAIAALLLQANSTFTPDQIYQRLQQTATDLGPNGVDNITGFGLVNAYDAIFGPAIAATADFTDSFEVNGSPTLSQNWETHSTGSGQIRIVESDASVGSYSLQMDAFNVARPSSVGGLTTNGINGLNEAILHFNATIGTGDITLFFDQREFNDDDHPMSATFTGSEFSDGVAISVDGINWIRLFDLTGSVSQGTYGTSVVNLTNLATSLGLTLGTDVRIKFQQYGNGNISGSNNTAQDGFVFDNVRITRSTEPNLPPIINPQAFGVAENAPNGTVVGTVIAVDPNAGQPITYSIVGSGNTGGAFVINASTGQITVNNSGAVTLANSPFSLTVRVADNGNPSLFTDAIITITVLPANQRGTTLFLDFGLGIGMGNTFSSTALEFRNIFGQGLHGDGTGSDLTADLDDDGSLDFTPFAYDYNGDSVINNDDLIALADAVVPIIQRAMEPFDIEVVVVGSADFAEALAHVQLNGGNAFGEFDAYNFIMDITSDALGGGSVGDLLFDPDEMKDGKDGLGLFGIAAADDLFAQDGNKQDEATLTFLDTVFSSTTGTIGSAAFNRNLAYRVAYTATHEAFHTFSYIHTTGSTAGQTLLTSGDVIRLGSVTRENPYFVTRFDLQRQGGFPVAEPNNYLLAANDSDIGLRDSNRNGTPDFAFVTGTGAHDVITLTQSGPNTVTVLVEAYSDSAHSVLIASETYTIDLTSDTEGSILIDGGINRDEIVIDGTITAQIRVRGGTGLDGVAGGEADVITVIGTGTDTPAGIGAGQIIATGGAIIDYEEIETVNVGAVGGNNPPVISPATFSLPENSAANTVVGTPTASDPDAGQTLTWAIVGGNTGNAFSINASTGQIRVLTPAALDFETNPTFSLLVRVTDNATSPLSAQATITINLTNVNEAPVIGNFTFTIPENSPNGTPVGTVSGTDPDGTGGTQTHVSTDVPVTIPDETLITSNLTVAGRSGAITDVNVTLDITHTFTGDLQVTLIAPDGTRIVLSQNRGGSGNDFSGTIFDDEATTPIGSGVAPFSGSFRPDQLLSLLDGKNANGQWQLEIDDQAAQDVGVLNSWSLTIATASTQPITYSLSGPNSSAFAINSVTGQITVANSTLLDFETNPVFNLIVTATDGTLSDTGNVTINLTDVLEVTSRLVAFGTGPYVLGLPYVDVYDAVSQTRKFRTLAYENTFRGGVKVATGDINRDGTDDVIVVPGKGRKTDVKIYSGVNGALLGSFLAFGAAYTGGATVDVGDVNNDGWLDVVVGNGAGVAPEIQVWNVRTSINSPTLLRSIKPFETTFRGGLDVGVGDVNGDNFADVVVGRATGKASVQVYSGQNGALLKTFEVYAATFTGGISVDVGDFNRDGRADIITGAGTGMIPEVSVYSGMTVLNAAAPVAQQKFLAYPNTYKGGVNVALRPAVAPGAPAGAMEIWTGYNATSTTRQATRFGFRAALPPLVLQNVMADTNFLGGLYVG
jgi:subtilisin-like proprotein convertase family protein